MFKIYHPNKMNRVNFIEFWFWVVLYHNILEKYLIVLILFFPMEFFFNLEEKNEVISIKIKLIILIIVNF